eukprot:343821-Rhodomonas_salina.1
MSSTDIGDAGTRRTGVGAYLVAPASSVQVCYGLVNADGNVLNEPDYPSFSPSSLSTAGAVSTAWRAVVVCRSAPLPAYARPTRCPVLTSRLVLYAMPGPDGPYGTTSCLVLRSRMALPGACGGSGSAQVRPLSAYARATRCPVLA